MKRTKTKRMKSGIVIFLIMTAILLSTTATSYQTKSVVVKESVVAVTSDLDIEMKWNRIWSGFKNDHGYSIWGNGTYVYTLGDTQPEITDIFLRYNFVLLKWDTDGNIIWNRTWGGEKTDYGRSIWGDGTYLYTLGYTNSFGAGSSDFALLKWDTDGNIIWYRTWGGSGYEEGYSIWGDGTYLYTLGATSVFMEGVWSYDLALLKWDTDGNIIWYRTWGGLRNCDEKGYSIWGDGTYLYTLGYTQSFGAGSSDFVLLKWDIDGNITWYRTWGGSGHEEGHSIWSDGTYLYTLGLTRKYGSTYHDFALLKWDTNGNIAWDRTWGGSGQEKGYSIWGNGAHLYTFGLTGSYGEGYYDFALLTWDTDGNIIWYRTWGKPVWNKGYSIWGDGTYLYTLGSTSLKARNTPHDLTFIKWGPDTTIPELRSVDINYEYEQGSTHNWIFWYATDSNPDIYIVYKDSIAIETDNWYSNARIAINVDGLAVGLYNYTIVVSDTSSNSERDTVIVTVTAIPVNITTEETTTENNTNPGNNNDPKNPGLTTTTIVTIPYPFIASVIAIIIVATATLKRKR